jgi:hypothetical protein
MPECYCAKIEDGVVTQVIVCGCAEWATQHLGGEWVCTDGHLIKISWPVVDGEIVEPTPEIEDE